MKLSVNKPVGFFVYFEIDCMLKVFDAVWARLKNVGKEYKSEGEEDGWSGFHQVGTNISKSEDGAWKKSKKGCTREECHEGTKKWMSRFWRSRTILINQVGIALA